MDEIEEEKQWVFVKFLDPTPSIRVHPKFIYSGFDIIGLFKDEEGTEITKVINFTPKRMHHRNTSKYTPHQGEQEKARRVRQSA